MKEVDTDVLVIGSGISGSICASLMAAQKKKVILVGKGSTSTALSTGCFGTSALDQKDLPELEESIQFFQSSISPFIRYDRSISEARLLTTEGSAYASSMAPHFTMAAKERGRYALLGIHGYDDFDPDRARQFGRLRCRSYYTALPGGKPSFDCSLAASLMDGESMEHLISALKDIPEDWVGLPPLFPLRYYHERMEKLERESGRQIFEMVAPLSLPGQRLQEALERMAVSSGSTFWKGREVTEIGVNRKEATSALVRSGMRTCKVHFSALLVAVGDPLTGGLIFKGREMGDPLSTFMVSNRKGKNVLDGVLKSGLKVDRHLRPYSRNSTVLRNVWAAGSAIPGISYASGGGLLLSLLTGWKSSHRALEVV